LILRKIIKIFATRCQILSLKCTKFDFGLRPHWGSLQHSHRLPSWIKVGLLLREEKGKRGNGREGKEGGGRREKGERGKGGRGGESGIHNF